MNKSQPDKLEAVFIGGDYSGQTILVNEAHPILCSVHELRLMSGETIRAVRMQYKLVSHGPPLRYEVDQV